MPAALAIPSGTPYFSIVMPAYNRIRLIGRAIESVQAQTFGGWELTVVDDGSTDKTAEEVRRRARQDGRIRLVVCGHAGAARARNLGIAVSKGGYVTFLDTDDEYLPDHLTLRRKYLREHPGLQMIHGGVEIVGNPFVPDVADPRRLIHISECVVGGTFVVERGLLGRVGGVPAVDYGEDTALFGILREAGAKIGRVEFPTYRYYRTEPDSICSTMGDGVR